LSYIVGVSFIPYDHDHDGPRSNHALHIYFI